MDKSPTLSTTSVKFSVKIVDWASNVDHASVKWFSSKKTGKQYIVITSNDMFQKTSGTTSQNTWRKLFSNWGFEAVAKSSPEYCPDAFAQYWHPCIYPDANVEDTKGMKRRQDVNAASNANKKRFVPKDTQMVVKTKREIEREKSNEALNKKE